MDLSLRRCGRQHGRSADRARSNAESAAARQRGGGNDLVLHAIREMATVEMGMELLLGAPYCGGATPGTTGRKSTDGCSVSCRIVCRAVTAVDVVSLESPVLRFL